MLESLKNIVFYSDEKNKDFSFTIKENVLTFSYEVNGNFEIYTPSQPDKTQSKRFVNGL